MLGRLLLQQLRSHFRFFFDNGGIKQVKIVTIEPLQGSCLWHSRMGHATIGYIQQGCWIPLGGGTVSENPFDHLTFKSPCSGEEMLTFWICQDQSSLKASITEKKLLMSLVHPHTAAVTMQKAMGPSGKRVNNTLFFGGEVTACLKETWPVLHSKVLWVFQ